jgi:hypothetical protein
VETYVVYPPPPLKILLFHDSTTPHWCPSLSCLMETGLLLHRARPQLAAYRRLYRSYQPTRYVLRLLHHRVLRRIRLRERQCCSDGIHLPTYEVSEPGQRAAKLAVASLPWSERWGGVHYYVLPQLRVADCVVDDGSLVLLHGLWFCFGD